MRLLILLSVALSLSCGSEPAPESDATVFVGATVFDGIEPIQNAVMVVEDGMVTLLGPQGTFPAPEGAETVDLTGKFVTPGLIVGHAHAGGSKGLQGGPDVYTEENILADLRLYADYGITTVVSLGGAGDAGIAVREAETPTMDHSRLIDAGPVVVGPTPEEARAQVAEYAAMGVDIIKIRVDDNLGTSEKMTPETYQAVIDEAHQKGLPVAAHIFYLEDAKGLLEAGVDFLAHSVRDEPVDAELIEMMKERNICLCPTLTREVSTFVYEQTPEFFSDPFFLRRADSQVLEQLKEPVRQKAMAESPAAQQYKQALEMAKQNLKTLAAEGVRIVFGTDSGPPARFEGYFEHMELDLMAEAGLAPAEIFRTATSNAAQCLGLPKVGILEPNRFADFVVYERDPLADVANSRTIESVWIGGEQLGR